MTVDSVHRPDRSPRSPLRAFALGAALWLAFAPAGPPALAGGSLDQLVLTDEPSPIPGEVLVPTVPIRQDARCLPVPYSLDTTYDPIPNPLGPPVLTLARTEEILGHSLASWNDIPTSYIDLRILGVDQPTAPFVFDTVHSINFQAGSGLSGVLATSPSVSLFQDEVLTDGTDLDGDGDPDVAAGIETCADVDGDGDWERPAGFYPAGTILDNDVWFNVAEWTWTDTPDYVFRTVDLEAVAAHEFGHSQGLSHTLLSEISADDGTQGTMFPFLDTSDAEDELGQRSPSRDDRGYSSYLYREGSAPTGPAALQPGDVAFDAVYGLLSGQVTHGVLGAPVAGASVSAVDRRTGEVVATTYSGAIQYTYSPATGLRLLPGFGSVLDGRWELPVEAGRYEIRIEAMDGSPVAGSRVADAPAIGLFLGLLDFDEEAWSRDREGAVEVAPSHATPVPVRAGETVGGLDLVTNRNRHIANFGTLAGFMSFFAPAGTYYAVRVPADQVLAAAGGEPFAVASADFFTAGPTAAQIPLFARAMIATGDVAPDGTVRVDVDRPLVEEAGFVGQDFDFTPLYPKNPVGLGERIAHGIASGAIGDLFLVLQIPAEEPFPGPLGLPALIGVDLATGPGDVPPFGLSYVSFDGETFFSDPQLNYMFRLVLTERP